MNHIIITPVYNEEKYIEKYINSIINQSLLPIELIMVDDNSSDNSSRLIKEYSKQYPWIKYIKHNSQNYKSQGKKIINAFNYGLEHCDISNIDFISKIDSDLEFPKEYFKQIANEFEENPQLGLCGGSILEKRNEVWTIIRQASYHVRGALKSYRKECFNQIGGILPVLGWDGLDEMKAMYHGWSTKNIDYGVKHYRPSSADYNKVDLSYKSGLANYLNGGNVFLAIVRSIVRLKQTPYFKIGFSFMKGYLSGYLKKEKRIVDKDLAAFINRHHFKRLFRLKIT